MRRLICALVAAIAISSGAPAGEHGSRAMSGWFNVTTPDGWKGRRYMDGPNIFAEEFDSRGTGRIDVWRFYRRGILTSEERDTNSDGRVDLVTRYDPNTGFLTAAMRDTNKRGIYDVEVERTGSRRWVVYEDRNLDGTTDRIVYVNAPPDLFERFDIDPATTIDMSAAIPREYWHEMWSDDGFTGSITDYFRYNNRGVLTHYGEWNGNRIAWGRCPPDFIPRPVTASVAADRPPAQRDVMADNYDIPPGPGLPPQPPRRDSTVRDPFDLSAGYGDADPYAGMPARRGDPGLYSGPGYEEPAAPPPRIAPTPPPSRDRDYGRERPRYESGGSPSGESSARAVPARMRPPGQSRTTR